MKAIIMGNGFSSPGEAARWAFRQPQLVRYGSSVYLRKIVTKRETRYEVCRSIVKRDHEHMMLNSGNTETMKPFISIYDYAKRYGRIVDVSSANKIRGIKWE